MTQQNPQSGQAPAKAKFERFCGTTPISACRVCAGKPSGSSVDAGLAPYATRWIQCADCGSWSVAWEPKQEALDEFYGNYAIHHKNAAINPDNNDGRRYTHEWRVIREREYRLGLADAGLDLSTASIVLDFGAQNTLFLGICRSIQPNIRHSIAVDYKIEEHYQGEHQLQSIATWFSDSTALDVVTLWDVYEHIAHLEAFMSTLSRRVARHGQVLVQTPRAGLHAEILGPLWHHFLPVQHLQLPSREGITRQFSRYGFELVQARSFGANAPPSTIPQPYKRLFDSIAKTADQGSTQILRFCRQ